jgi:2-hydroxychromene-2-carboxylate isomerase
MAGSSTDSRADRGPREGARSVSSLREGEDLLVVSKYSDDTLPSFYFDLAVPEGYLAAERILSVMPGPCEWIPVPASELAGGGWGAWRCAEEREIELSQLERVAAERRLQPVRWPEDLPFDSSLALRAATFAKGAGKTVAFTLAAFRQAFAAGRDLSVPENVLIAGAACEIHPRALLQGAETRSVRARLAEATETARSRGVLTVPAVWADGEVFHGDAALERAAKAVARAPR